MEDGGGGGVTRQSRGQRPMRMKEHIIPCQLVVANSGRDRLTGVANLIVLYAALNTDYIFTPLPPPPPPTDMVFELLPGTYICGP